MPDVNTNPISCLVYEESLLHIHIYRSCCSKDFSYIRPEMGLVFLSGIFKLFLVYAKRSTCQLINFSEIKVQNLYLLEQLDLPGEDLYFLRTPLSFFFFRKKILFVRTFLFPTNYIIIVSFRTPHLARSNNFPKTKIEFPLRNNSFWNEGNSSPRTPRSSSVNIPNTFS